MTEELKKCPFCGKGAVLIEDCDHHGKFYNLGCSDKKCMANNILYTITEDDMPLNKAIEAWNQRA